MKRLIPWIFRHGIPWLYCMLWEGQHFGQWAIEDQNSWCKTCGRGWPQAGWDKRKVKP